METRQFPYQPLQQDSIRLLQFLPQGNSEEIHLRMTHHFLGDEDPDQNLPPVQSPDTNADYLVNGTKPFNEMIRVAVDTDWEYGSGFGSMIRKILYWEPMPIEARCTTLAYALARRVFKGMKYIALSYCWGDPNNRRCIHLNGQVISVTLNLWRALSGILLHHHSDEIKYYWIDALCINQRDEREKTLQVRRMWKIYASAFETFASVTHEDILLDLNWTDTSYNPLSQRWFIQKGAEAAARRASMQEYFSRTWIQSEVLQARKATFLYGRHRYDSYDLYKIFSICKIIQHDRSDGSSVLNNCFCSLADEHRSSLDGLLQHYMFTQCSDRRDVRFALHADPRTGLQGGIRYAKELQPDYSVNVSLLALRVMSFRDRAHPEDEHSTQIRLRSSTESVYEHEWRNLLDGLHLPRIEPRFTTSYPPEEYSRDDSIIDNFCWSLLPLLKDRSCLTTTTLEFHSGHRIRALGPRLEEVLRVLQKVSIDGWTPRDPIDISQWYSGRRGKQPQFSVLSSPISR